MAARLREKYNREIRKTLVKEFGYQNEMMVPKLSKIVVSMGVGDAVADKKKLTSAIGEMTLITGQKPVATAAKKSIAAFKLREEMLIGAKVTLRKDRMFEFLDRLINVAMPRIRDFRGINPKAFDGLGNYSMGLKEQLIFPEIEYDRIDVIRGMNICFVTTANTNEEAKALLKAFNMPFANQERA